MGRIAYLDLFLLGTAGCCCSIITGCQTSQQNSFLQAYTTCKDLSFQDGQKTQSFSPLWGRNPKQVFRSLSGRRRIHFCTKANSQTHFCCTEPLSSISLHVSLVPAQIKMEAAV